MCRANYDDYDYGDYGDYNGGGGDGDDGDVAKEVDEEDRKVVMNSGQPIEFDEDDTVMAQPAPSPVARRQGSVGAHEPGPTRGMPRA